MSRVLLFVLTLLITAMAVGAAFGRSNQKKPGAQRSAARLAGLASKAPTDAAPFLSSATVDTTVLASFSFDSPIGGPDSQGWVTVDLTAQVDVFGHVADATELDGGNTGGLVPLSGNRSMWCGVSPSTAAPYCAYLALPGYGNQWEQLLCTSKINADSVVVSYTVFWDSEEDYDFTFFEWSADSVAWNKFAVGDTFSTPSYAGWAYHGTGPYPGDGGHNAYLTETFSLGPSDGATSGCIWLRFRFVSDYFWSDQDNAAGFDSDGAFVLDDITVRTLTTGGTLLDSTTTTFESAPLGGHSGEHGLWTAAAAEGFGDYAQLHSGRGVVQEDPCQFNATHFWGFFDDPEITAYLCHTPDPLPEQGAVPYERNYLYISNEIWSPPIANTGTGDKYILAHDQYVDSPDSYGGIFSELGVRVWNNGCPENRTGSSYPYFEENRVWKRHVTDLSGAISPGDEEIQIMLGVWDYGCDPFLGCPPCHSHAPLIDNVQLLRLDVNGPRAEFSVNHRDLFYDAFAEDGTLTGLARADTWFDVALVTVKNLTTDPITGVGPSLYAYVAIWPQNQPGKSGSDIEAQDTWHFPHVGTEVHGGVNWDLFRLYIESGPSTYQFDLRDDVFTPGDTICYFFCAEDDQGRRNYFSRRFNGHGESFVTNDLQEALSSPMEFTILPAGGWARGGDILHIVDGSTAPGAIQIDSALEALGIEHLVDRFDRMDDEFAELIANPQVQVIDCYRTIIWSAGDAGRLSVLLGPSGPNDYRILYDLLDTRPDNPGVYMNGSYVTDAWISAMNATDPKYHTWPIALRDTFMSFDLVADDHKQAGEPVSPLLTATGPCFTHLGVPDKLIAHGSLGCRGWKDFDVFAPTGIAQAEFQNLATGRSYIVSQETMNSAGSTARFILSGFGFEVISDDEPAFPPDRIEHLADILAWLQNSGNAPVGIPTEPRGAPTNRLDSAFPNPFNPVTTIRYSIDSPGPVLLRVYDVTGALVRTLVNEVRSPRTDGFVATWNGRDDAGVEVASGVYFYRLTAPGFTQTRKMVLLK